MNSSFNAVSTYFSQSKKWPSKAILIFIATSVGISSCVSPSRVRNGNQKEYFVDKQVEIVSEDNQAEKISLADTDSANEIDEIDLDFSRDLQAVTGNSDFASQENGTGIIDSELDIPSITKDEANELSKLTAELFAKNPNLSDDNNQQIEQVAAVTGLPTLQNQIDALNETYLEFDEKIEDIVSDVSELEGRMSNVEDDIASLESKVDKLIKEKSKSVYKREKKDTPSSSKTAKHKSKLKGYKLLSDEEISSKEEKTESKNISSELTDSDIVNSTQKSIESSDPSELKKLKSSMAFKVAMNSISKKNYKQSTIQLNRLRDDYTSPESLSEIDYWLGESAYGQKQYQKALTKFDVASMVQNSERADDASAMKAECMIKLGRIKEAKKEYKEFISQFPESTLIPRARKMLQQL